jgi:hypothetical protein
MRTRLRTATVGVAAAIGVALAGGTAVAASPSASDVSVMDYWQYHDTYPTYDECVAAAQPWLYPTHPGGADDFACEPADAGGWDLFLIFAT